MPKRKPADDEKPKKSAAKKKSAQNAEESSVDKKPKGDIDLSGSGKSSAKKESAQEKLAAAPVNDDDEQPDSRIFKMLQGMRLSPEEARESAVNTRNLLIESWNCRDELYRELFGEPAYVTP